MMLETTQREPTTVGEILHEEYLKPLNITQQQLAVVMGVSRKTICELCTGKRRLTIEDAVKLSALFETSTEFWINLQAGHDRWEACQYRALGGMPKPIVELLGRRAASI